MQRHNGKLISDLRVGGRLHPLGVPATSPRMSWSVAADVSLVAPTFVVRVAESPEALATAPLWEASTDRPWITYAGPEVRSRQRLVWDVTIDGTDHRSDIASWEIGLASTDDWTASWIHGHLEPYRYEAWDPTPYLRHEFTVALGDAAGIGRLYASALGLYRLWVNGTEVTADSHYRPGWTDYATRVLHQTYDVSDLLVDGPNVVAAIAAKGWYAGRLGLVRRPRHYGEQPAFIAQLELDGTVVAATSTDWRTSVGSILNTDLLRGETHDLRREPHGWDRPGFDDSNWELATTADATIIPPSIDPQPNDTIVTCHEHAGELVHEHARGPLVFDFRQNLVGWTRIDSPFAPPADVIVRHGEVLTPEQLVYRDNLRGAFQEDYYVVDGDGPGTLEPRFTMHGFRYAEVWNLPSTTEYGQFKVHPNTSITAISVTGLGDAVGTFESSNAELTKLASNIEWTVRDNFLEAATDCPQRDERHGWLGDAGVIIPTAAYFFDVSSFLVKFAQDAADGQRDDGAMPNYVPAVPPATLGPGAPGWSDGYIRLVHLLCQRYGDLPTAARLFPSMVRFLAHLDTENPDGLRVNAVGANFGDWLSLPENPDAPFHFGFEYTGAYSTTPHNISGTAHSYRSFVQLAEIANWLGHDAEAARLRNRADVIADVYRDTFVRADGEIVGGTHTAYAQAINYGLLADDAVAGAQRLRDSIERVGYVTCGIHGVEHVLPALGNHGHDDFARSLLLRTDIPSWLYMVTKDATTIWEKWRGIEPDGTLATAEMNSFNHYALGAVGRYVFERIGGIDATTTAWDGAVRVRTNYGRELDWVRCTYASPTGTIASSWRWNNGTVEHELTIPGSDHALVEVPAGAAVALQGGDVVSVDSEGRMRLGAGTHHLVVSGLPA